MTSSNLSQRGREAAASLADIGKLADVMSRIYDPVDNPDGVVFLGLTDNALLRPELLKYINSRPPNLTAPELTYADAVCAQSSVLRALAHLYNTVPDGIDPATFEQSRKPLLPVQVEHLIVGSGASGIMDNLLYSIAAEGEALLLSTPYYNGFDRDFTRDGIKIIPVQLDPLQETTELSDFGHAGQPCFEEHFVQAYEDALVKAQQEGVTVRALLVCNPHNPTGAVISREAIVDLAKFAAKHALHLISDEIYSRGIFSTSLVEKPNEFHSVLSIDVLAEAGLDPSFVHVVTSASKDFAINGFRLGVLISQHNKELRLALLSNSILNQPGSVGGAIWRDLIMDTAYLHWYLDENKRRLRDAFEYVAKFCAHYKIPFVPANSCHFFLVNLSKFLKKPSWEGEGALVDAMIEAKVFINPGQNYHTRAPGYFRFTFSQPPAIVREGLIRLERLLKLNPWIASQPVPVWKGPSDEITKASDKFRDTLQSQDLSQSLSGLSIQARGSHQGAELSASHAKQPDS